MYIGFHVKHPLFSSNLVKLEFFRQIFEKYSNIKFHENPSSGSRVVPCGQTDMTKLIVAFRNFANAPNKGPTESRSIAPHFLQLDTTRKCQVHTLHTPVTLPQGIALTKDRVGLSAGLDTLQVGKILLPFPGIETTIPRLPIP